MHDAKKSGTKKSFLFFLKNALNSANKNSS